MHIIISNTKITIAYFIDFLTSNFRVKFSQIVSKMDFLYV
jgi:hypothetical protein